MNIGTSGSQGGLQESPGAKSQIMPLMEFGPAVSLVPDSGVQFMDFGFHAQDLLGVRRRFYEESGYVGAGSNDEPGLSALHSIVLEDSLLRHPLTQEPLSNDETITVTGTDALKPFLNEWVPIPFMRVVGKDDSGGKLLDEGPANWTRVYVSAAALDGKDKELPYRVVVAIDTRMEAQEHSGDAPYLAPSQVDVSLASKFSFSDHADDVAWFVAEPWVDAWVEKLFLRAKGIDRLPMHGRRSQFGLAHIASYLTFLTTLAELCSFPEIKFIDTAMSQKHAEPVMVDLVLDIGNSRSFALLMEGHDELGAQDLQRAKVLTLRDLSNPVNVYADAFDSHVEFVPPSFGNQALSRQSGRSNAFCWPSFARVGTEATRAAAVAATRSGAGRRGGASGISSPKRYLWDCQPNEGGWQFSSSASGRVSGPLLQYISEDGDVLGMKTGDGASLPAVRPKFSRSSLLSFFLCEVLLQAITQMNSPYSRARQPRSNAVRQLRRIVVTMPVGMPPEECHLLQQRLDGAVELVWQSLGWSGRDAGGAPPRPAVDLGIDEAMCTQMVYLYDQIARKFSGPVQDYFSLKGKARGETGVQSVLRVASIDIGAGATGLAVLTYCADGETRISATQQLRVGVHVGGDDVMQAIVVRHVIPAIEEHLGAKGLDRAQEFLRGLLSDKMLGQSAARDLLRKRLVAQVLSPLAMALALDYEKRGALGGNEAVGRSIKRWLPVQRAAADAADAAATQLSEGMRSSADPVSAHVIADFDATIAAEGIEAFSLADVVLSYRPDDFSATIRRVLGGVLADLSDIACAMDCDLCLVSGRSSHLPDVLDLLLARMPVRPDRIVMMHEYQPGGWYPLRDAAGCIADAKTVVALGALIHSLSDGRLAGFQLSDAAAQNDGTAARMGHLAGRGSGGGMQRYIGRIDDDGRLTRVDTPVSITDKRSDGRSDGRSDRRSPAAGGRAGGSGNQPAGGSSGRLVVLEVNEDAMSGGAPPALSSGNRQLPVAAPPPGSEDVLLDPGLQSSDAEAGGDLQQPSELLRQPDPARSDSNGGSGARDSGAGDSGAGDAEDGEQKPSEGHWLDTGVIGSY